MSGRPIYWYAVGPAMKIFLDRITGLLELPDLLAAGPRLRGNKDYVVCTSIRSEASTALVDAFRETFDYLGMQYGGLSHLDCKEGYSPAVDDPQAVAFAARVRTGALP